MFVNLTAWQMLLWIAGLELISIPLCIFMFNSIMIGYYKIKEQHQTRFMKAISEVIAKAGNDLSNLAKSKVGNNKEDTKDEH